MSRLSSTNPELFTNPTLGEATTSPFLDQVTEQAKEDFNARVAKREPRTVVAVGRYPKFMKADTVPSNVKPELKYADDDGDNVVGVPEDSGLSLEDL